MIENSETQNTEDLMNSIKQERISLTYEGIKLLWGQLVSEIKAGKKKEVIDFFANIPFCSSKCRNCYFFQRIPKNDIEIESYLRYIEDAAKFFKEAFEGVRFTNLYIGGGTPSILTTEQIERVLKVIFENFKFFDYGERTFECNPWNMDEEKIKAIKKLGMNRVTFGVQSMNPELLRLHYRGHQTKEMVDDLIMGLQKHKLYCNADLIFGMKKQSIKDVIETIDYMMKKKVNQITLHRMMNQSSIDHADNTEKKLEMFRKELIPHLEKVARKNGYSCKNHQFNIGSFLFNLEGKDFGDIIAEKGEFRIPKGCKRFIGYTDIPNYPFSFFGIGPMAQNYVFGHAKYKMLRGIEKSIVPEETAAEGFAIDPKEEIAIWIVKSMGQGGSFSLDEFREIFDFGFEEEHAALVKEYAENGKIKIENGMLFFTGNDYGTIKEFLGKVYKQQTAK